MPRVQCSTIHALEFLATRLVCVIVRALLVLGGFASLDPPFTVQRLPTSDKLPSASTCFNLLKLPDYAAHVAHAGQRVPELGDKLSRSVLDGTTGFAFS